MRTVGQAFKKVPGFLLFLLLISAHGQVSAEAEKTADGDSYHGHKSLDWPGIYNGLLPCADCYGVKTSLALNKNNTYILIYQYTGKSPKDFVEKGKFSWGEKNNTIILTPRKGNASRQFLIGDNTLTELDGKGKLISGEQAARYILRRTDVTSEPTSHSGH
ncbi:copper resistance protein NlpE [Methylomonas sp. SURF-2]|uniref:Copper resistance protein NlpE n=1 Tax=Methylomonas subterranea TaxID=2952225 RepID=A0ABT1TGV1_9GAMM|nr:copper resistance protein NlpE [Methylomonas sp. SURF-2]MCQ8104681.1 copper resistance protein NlpE [Methylomonas sp. SURF-2]